VALVDTGVAAVPDLADRVIATANFSDETSHEDTYGHGTFQAGLIAGDGSSSGGAYTGVAPEADLLSVKVAGADGSTSLGQVLAGVQLVDSAADRFNVRVLLLAVDSESPLPPDLDPLSWALRTVWSHGVVVVVPAGNNGGEPGSIAAPGEDPWLLTAGSVDDQGTPDVSDDTVAHSTGTGPTRWGDEKPEIAAPGEHLVSVRAPGSTVDAQNPGAVVGDDYFRGSGTSMSAAVTAGAAALLVQARPELSPDEVKMLFQATAQPIPDGDAASIGAGVVDAAAAVAFDGELPDLPSLPDLGEAEEPFTPPGLRYDWRRDEDGVWRWDSDKANVSSGQDQARGDAEWNARRWADVEWAARRWAQADWAARQWAARQWAARQWAARRWAARQWSARQWNARQWSMDEWNARQWSARQWSADEWEARQWSARQWSARQWSARQWSARQWSARQWS
jgi:serine protease AprX